MVLHDRVAAVVGLDGQRRSGPVGQDRVIAEHHIYRQLRAGCGTHPADDQAGGGLVAVPANAVEVVSAMKLAAPRPVLADPSRSRACNSSPVSASEASSEW